MPGNPHLADVAVPVGVATTFTYLIPEDLRGSIAPGHRVPIVLGRRKTHGYVVRLHDGPAPERLRTIGPPDPPEPVFASDILDLTRWVADYYLAPWGEVLEAAAPRGRGRAALPADPPDDGAARGGPSSSSPPTCRHRDGRIGRRNRPCRFPC